MAECNVSLPFQCVKPDCKYSYASWCPTCEKESPRRRTKSETYEPCKRKGKEMKTFTPKKFDKHRGYENMDLEYDSKDLRMMERVRTNLCELPTSYITNNVNKNGEYLDMDYDGFCDRKHYEEKPYKQTNYNGITKCMLVESKVKSKRSPPPNPAKSSLSPPVTSNKSPLCTKPHHHLSQNSILCSKASTSPSSNSPQTLNPPATNQSPLASSPKLGSSPSSSPKYRLENNDIRPIFETCTFFDKQIDPVQIKERYAKELEVLREKLRDLRSNRYNPANPPMTIQNLDVQPKPPAPEVKVIEIVRRPRIDVVDSKSETKRNCRISVKTKGKFAALRSAKLRARTPRTQQSLESDSSDLEGSEKEECDEVNSDVHETSHETGFEKPLVLKTETDSSPPKDSGDAPSWPLRDSLFPNIPPYIKFNRHDDAPNKLPGGGHRFLKWKLSTITPIVVRKTLTNTGFRLVRKSNEWLGTWGKHMKSPMFRTLKSSQKLNHFAGTFQLGRKDRLWRNLHRLMLTHGGKEFGIIPQTYVLPHDLRHLKQQWEFKDGSGGEKWIIKPPASARGVGIKVINKWSQLPKASSLIVQRYIADPYLINGSKFDLRLYVLATSFNPLRIYLYPEGLVRFASVKYSDDDKDLKDRYMHLTNYSINKLSSQYTANEDANSCQGHKWTLSKLWEYMEIKGIDTKELWTNLKHLVIKTMISGESPITQLCGENVQSRYNCYELFGVDVLLDSRLKPWLLEVNISPSLHSTSPLDLHVKGPLVQTLFNLAQFHLPSKLSKTDTCPPCYDPRIYTTTLLKKESTKHNLFSQTEKRQDYLEDILDNLTGDDVRYLTQAEDEFVVKGQFERIFPTSKSYTYLDFMPPRYYNRLFDAWETKYENNRKEGIARLKVLCSKRVHLKIAPATTSSKSSLSTSLGQANVPQPSTEGQSHPDQCQILSAAEKTDDNNDQHLHQQQHPSSRRPSDDNQ
ncbi:PREDICTED: tubulin polyglutamylase TTLL4-like isoform X2 [Nicrophorus vespilloides]|uniref:Tubulin polyglutamylase TTLL4-like isoform X2 n=1 Tax=Nicrophorus vespilloides TaxID=110193 RepID=A0ABM1MX55_NICVS|nr:PREDICTED: tubulin polyglutamylase TTLL4-like isoform X2 [Nicrophorus vespilloides]